MDYRVLNLGDRAITFEFGSAISRRVNHHVLGVHTLIKEEIANNRLNGIIESVPTFRSLTVHYDPLRLFPDEVEKLIAPFITKDTHEAPSKTLWSFPACYDADYAPDLEDVARQTGLSVKEVIAIHENATYDVFMLGFLPGFAFMGLLDERLQLPRRPQPRTAVPEGSLAIANELTAVYPSQSPGGWHLIGRMPVDLFDAGRAEPVLLSAGDSVTFHRVSAPEFDQIRAAVIAGDYDYKTECQLKEAA